MWSRQHSRACTHSLWPLCIQVLAGGAVAASQLTGTIGSAMAKLSLGDDFVRARERAREGRPKNMVDGLLQGGVGLGRGVVEGLTGLVTAPLEGAQNDGVAGFVKGVGRGLVGLPAKSAAGTFDFLSLTAKGIANTFDLFEADEQAESGPHQRLRLPRMMHGPEQALQHYSRSEAIAQRVLTELRDGSYLREPLLLSVTLPARGVLVLTEQRLLLASAPTYKTDTHVPLTTVQEVRLIASYTCCGMMPRARAAVPCSIAVLPAATRTVRCCPAATRPCLAATVHTRLQPCVPRCATAAMA